MPAAYLGVTASADASWRYHIDTGPAFEFTWGFHHEYELYLITHGTGHRLVGDSIETYQPGDLVLIGAGLPHTYVSEPGSTHNKAVSLMFAPDFLGGSLWDYREFEGITELLHEARRGLAFTRSTAALHHDLVTLGGLPGARRTITLLATLQTLAEDGHRRPLASPGFSPTADYTARRRIDTICRHLESNYTEDVTLTTVADLVCMSPPALSKFFRRAMGRTLTDYLNELRLAAACRLLIDTDDPISKIAHEAGYKNLSYFNRRFKERHHAAPRDYRAHHRAISCPGILDR